MAGFYEPLLEDQYQQIFWRKLAKFYVLLDDLDFCTERKIPSQILYLYTDNHQSKMQSAVT